MAESEAVDESQISQEEGELPKKGKKAKKGNKKLKNKGPGRWDEVNVENDRRVSIPCLSNLTDSSLRSVIT